MTTQNCYVVPDTWNVLRNACGMDACSSLLKEQCTCCRLPKSFVSIFLWFNCLLDSTYNENRKSSKKTYFQDFPGGAVVKNPPANAGDTGCSPGPGRSHTPWSNKAHAPQLLSLHSRACEPQLLSPRATTTEARAPRARAPQQEKPPQ